MAGIRPLLADPGLAQVTARATLTRDDLDLAGRHDALAAEGFRSIGFAPVRVGAGALGDDDWPRWLAASVALGERELAVIRDGGDTTFDNFSVALRRLEAGSSSPYPCGAGGGYASVSTAGQWYACHRAIGDDDYLLGDHRWGRRRPGPPAAVPGGPPRRAGRALPQLLGPLPVQRRVPPGGRHPHRRRRATPSAAWLEFCLDAYCVVSSERPGWFQKGGA